MVCTALRTDERSRTHNVSKYIKEATKMMDRAYNGVGVI
jgi:hypothetical protein